MTTTTYNWYTYNGHMEKLRELRENWCSSYMTHLLDNYQTTLFDISSNCLFCGNSDKNYGDKDVWTDPCVNIWLPIDGFTVFGARDKRDNEWTCCIRTKIEHI